MDLPWSIIRGLRRAFPTTAIVITSRKLSEAISSEVYRAGATAVVPLDALSEAIANLMQVFLNLTTNSVRSLAEKPGQRCLTISARNEGDRVRVEVLDNGGGVAQPSDLFHPFQTGARNTGLGLYLARAFARSFGGDLRYQPMPNSACFIVELAPVRSLDPIESLQHTA